MSAGARQPVFLIADRRILYIAAASALSKTRRMVMEHAGYVVKVKDSAAEAVSALRQETFDLVVIGNRMPTTEAEAIAKATRAHPSRPLLVCLDNRARVKSDYTLRPLAGPEELLAVLGEALVRRHGHPAPEGACYMFVDQDRRYIHVTDGATELLGYSRGELIGRTIDEISAPEMQVEKRFNEYVEAGKQSGTFRLRRHDGSFVTVRYVAEVLPDGCMVSQLTLSQPVHGENQSPSSSRKVRP